MSDARPELPETLPALPAYLDHFCERFEAACKVVAPGGPLPRPEDYLGETPPADRVLLLQELVALEVAYRRRRGEVPTAAAYRERFPDLDPAWVDRELQAASTAVKEVAKAAGPERIPQTQAQQIRCPHCHNPIQMVDDRPDEVLCPGCGSSFRVRDARHTATVTPSRPLGKFQLLERVGVGAFGAVWKARDTELDRIVALKIPHSGLLTADDERERFHREARAAANLRHPGLVTVHEVVALEGLPCIVADFIQGVPLKDLLEVRRPTFREAAALLADVADALDYAHERGMVHRDVKPANIMIEAPLPPAGEVAASPDGQRPRPAGRPLLMDFGLALRGEAEVTMTLDGHILGTPAYMSPEQAAGRSHQADRRSDVYSLGVVLYELLTGELPFRGSRLMLLQQVLSDEPRPPRRVSEKIPRDLETICLKALQKALGDRYATARDLADDLRRFLRGEPVRARPVGRAEKAWRWCRRNPTLAGLTAAVAGSLVAGAILSTYFALQAKAKAETAVQERERADEKTWEALELARMMSREKDRADHNAAEARVNLYAAHMNLAQNAWNGQRVGQVLALLEMYQEPRPNERDLRGWEWHYQWRLCHDELRSMYCDKGFLAVAYSPDGRLLAAGGKDGTVRLWDVTTNRDPRILPAHTRSIGGLAFSPDGKLLASSGDGMVELWDVMGGERIRSIQTPPGRVGRLSYSPDGRQLAGACADITVRVWDVASGRERHCLQGHTHSVISVAFSPDGQQVASASGDWTVRLWDAGNGQLLRTLEGHTWGVLGLAFSPDGKRLASAGADKSLRVWDAGTGKTVRNLVGHTDEVLCVTYSPDGQRLASSGLDGGVRVWDAASGRTLRTLLRQTGHVVDMAFSPDGQRLALVSSDGALKVLQVIDSQDWATPRGQRGDASQFAMSPDWRFLATVLFEGGAEQTVQIWDAVSGKLLRSLRAPGKWVAGLAFSSDGMRLAWGYRSAEMATSWDLNDGRVVHLRGDGPGAVFRVAFSPDGQRLLSSNTNNMPTVWDLTTGRQLFLLEGHKGRTDAIAYSPDGMRLASGDAEGTIRVWDATTGRVLYTVKSHTKGLSDLVFRADGQQLISAGEDNVLRLWNFASDPTARTLKGHGAIRRLTFSPDGWRLASVDSDGMLGIWDPDTGQGLRALPIPNAAQMREVSMVAFSPDGYRLAVGSRSGLQVWDARPMTPPLLADREAWGQFESLCARSNSKEELLDRLRGNRSITEAVRQRAVALAESLWEGYLAQAAADLVRSLFAQPLLREEVIARVRADIKLREALRQRALELAAATQENAPGLISASWDVVQDPRADSARYHQALRWAEAACQVDPDNWYSVAALGIAQYRTGKYAEALATLTRSTKLGGGHPGNVAFLAMTHLQLGQVEQAQVRLQQMQELLKQETWAKVGFVQAFLREAEELFARRGKADKP